MYAEFVQSTWYREAKLVPTTPGGSAQPLFDRQNVVNRYRILAAEQGVVNFGPLSSQLRQQLA